MKKLKFENTATIKKSAKRRKLDKSQISSSESDTDLSTHDTDDDLSDELEDLEELKDFNLSAGDFVLVRFPVKNSMVHFIGQILELNSNIAKIKFLRRKGRSATFYYPPVDDITNVEVDDIISKVQQPSKSGTARTSSYFKFSYNFTGLIVQ